MSLLAIPLNVRILEALAEDSRALMDLRRAVGSPAQTTLRGHLHRLGEQGVLERKRRNEIPGRVDLELTRAGRDLIGVVEHAQAWLAAAPDGPLELGSPAGRDAIKALAGGWSSSIVRILAARPLALADLNRLIADLNYPSLERRLVAMRTAGLVVAVPGKSRGTPYAATEWLRRAVAPLAAAACWERDHAPERTSAITRIDIEAAFLLAVPLVRLAAGVSGVCRLAVEARQNYRDPRFAGVVVRFEDGRVVSCVSRMQGGADAWVSGSASAWMRALVEQRVSDLETGGDDALARALLQGLGEALLPAASTDPRAGKTPGTTSFTRNFLIIEN